LTLFIFIVFVALDKKRIISIRSQMLFQKLARYLSQKEYVKSAVEEGADLSIFRQRPGVRVYAGLVIFALNYILGWPAVAFLGFLAMYLKDERIFIIGAPAVYGFSWLLVFIGSWLAGKDYIKALTRWFGRVFVERFIK